MLGDVDVVVDRHHARGSTRVILAPIDLMCVGTIIYWEVLHLDATKSPSAHAIIIRFILLVDWLIVVIDPLLRFESLSQEGLQLALLPGHEGRGSAHKYEVR